VGRFNDPAGIPPKILSNGSIVFLRVRLTFAIDGTVLTLLAPFLEFGDKPLPAGRGVFPLQDFLRHPCRISVVPERMTHYSLM